MHTHKHKKSLNEQYSILHSSSFGNVSRASCDPVVGALRPYNAVASIRRRASTLHYIQQPTTDCGICLYVITDL